MLNFPSLTRAALTESPPISNLQSQPFPERDETTILEQSNSFTKEEEEVHIHGLHEMIERVHRLASRFPGSVNAEQLDLLASQFNEVLQREACFALSDYQIRIVQLRKMVSQLQQVPPAEGLVFVLKQHLIHAEQAAEILYLESATPVQDSLWPLYERILRLPTLEPDLFGAAVAFLNEKLPYVTSSNFLTEQLQNLLPKLQPPSCYLWSEQEIPFNERLENLEKIKTESLTLLHRLKQAPEGYVKKQFYAPIERVFNTYRDFLEAFNIASVDKQQEMCLPKAQLSGPGLGFFSLEQSIARSLVSCDELGKLCKRNVLGTHAVHFEEGVFYKPNTDDIKTRIHPEMEFAIYALYQRLGREGVAATALVKLDALFFEGQSVPQGRTLQVGYGIAGIPLQDLLDIANVLPSLTASLGDEKARAAFQWLMEEEWQEEFVHAHPHLFLKELASLDSEESSKRLLDAFKGLFEKRAATKRCLEFANLNALDQVQAQFSKQSPTLLVGCLALLNKYSGLALTSSKDRERFPPTGVHPVSYEQLIDLQLSMKKIKDLFPNQSAEQLLVELPQLMRRFDPVDFSTHFVATMLTNPCDHRADNLMVKLTRDDQNGIHSFSLVGIDNDLAFASSEGSVRTVLYLLDLMNAPFDASVAQELLKITPEEFVLDWLVALEEQNQSYERWLNRGIKIQDSLDIPLSVNSSLIRDVYVKMKQLRGMLETNLSPTHWEILRTIQPELAKVYERASKLGDNPIMAYGEVESLFRKEKLYPPSFEEESAPLISPKMATLQFLKTLNLSSFSIKQQVSLIGKALRTFPFLANSLSLPEGSADPLSRRDFFLMAVTQGHCALVARLLEEERKSRLGKEEESFSLIEVTNEEEQTALLLACLRLDLEMIQLLIHYGADPNVWDIKGRHIFALCLTRFPEAPGQTAAVVRFLGEQPTVFLNTSNKYLGSSALHYLVQVAGTASEEAEPLIAYLIKKGANPDLVDDQGKSPLDNAIEWGQERLVKQLIQLGAGRTLDVKAARIFFDSRPHLQETFAFLQSHSLLLRWHLALDALRNTHFRGSKVFLKGAQLGEIALSTGFAKKLLNEEGNIRPAIAYGRRNVNKVTLPWRHNLFFKQYPEMAGVEYAVDKLFELLIGHGTSLTDLAKLTPLSGKSYPILISQGIQGENLHDVLSDTNKAKQLEKLDPLAYSELLIASLLVNFEDAKPDNFILELQPGGSYRLVGIDNDHAFVPPLVKEGGNTVQVKCILYCLDQMRLPIHPAARERFLSFTPERLMRLWLNQLDEQNQRYCALFSEKERREFFETKNTPGMVIPIPFKPGAMVEMYQKFQRLQIALKESPDVTGMALLRVVIPALGIRYEEAFQAYENPLDRFLSLTKTQYSVAIAGRYQTLVNSRQMLQSMAISEKSAWDKTAEHGPNQAMQELELLQQESQASSQRLGQIRNALQEGDTTLFKQLQLDTIKEKVINGIPGAFEGIDFSAMQGNRGPDLDRQKNVLSAILKGKYRSLRFKGCVVLDQSALNRLFRRSPQLLSLELYDCPAVSEKMLTELSQARYLAHLRLNSMPSLGQVTLPHPTLRRLEIMNCQGLQKLTIGHTLKSLSVAACWNLASIEAKLYEEASWPRGPRLRKEPAENFVLQNLHLKACPKVQPWWVMFEGWLKESPEHQIQLQEVPPYPKLKNQKHLGLVLKAVLQRPEGTDMFAFLCQQPMGKEILAFLCRHPEGKDVLVSLLQQPDIRQKILAFALQQPSLSVPSLRKPIKQNVLAPSLPEPEGKEMLAFLLQQPDAKEILASLRNFEESGEADGRMGALVGNRSLTRFDAPCPEIFNDTLLEAVAKACPNLSHISLRNCDGITDVGLQMLAQLCPNLSEVDLKGCFGEFTVSGIEALVKGCPKLSSVCLSESSLSNGRGESALERFEDFYLLADNGVWLNRRLFS